MSETPLCYPAFKNGQIVTADDLNRMHEWHDSMQRFDHWGLFGFGVACGLNVTVDGGGVTVGKGFALAQEGYRLLLEGPLEVEVGDERIVSAEDVPFKLDETAEGYTVVLRAKPQTIPFEQRCEEGAVTCAPVSDRVCEGVEVVFVAGCPVMPPRNSAFDLEPLYLTDLHEFDAAAFQTLREGLVEALAALVAEFPEDSRLREARDILAGMEPAEYPAQQAIQINVLNEVLFALWEYLRCRRISSGACEPEGLPSDMQPAVALGRLLNGTGGWEWHCECRHHFRLAPALYLGLQGAGCADLCRVHLEQIQEPPINMVIPEVPEENEEPDPDPGDGAVVLCDLKTLGWKKYLKCIGKLDLRQPLPLPGDGEWGYGFDPDWWRKDPGWIDPMPEVVRVDKAIGYRAEAVADRIRETLRGRDRVPHVEVVDEAEIPAIAGARPGLAFPHSSTIYVGKSANGAAVAFAGKPLSEELSTGFSELKSHGERLAEVESVVPVLAEHTGKIETATERVVELEQQLAHLDGKVGGHSKEAIDAAIELAGAFDQRKAEIIGLAKEAVAETVEERFTTLRADVVNRINSEVTNRGEEIEAKEAVLKGEVKAAREVLNEGIRTTKEVLTTDLSTAKQAINASLDRVTRDVQVLEDRFGEVDRKVDTIGVDMDAIVDARVALKMAGVEREVDILKTMLAEQNSRVLEMVAPAEVEALRGKENEDLLTGLKAMKAVLVENAPQAERARLEAALNAPIEKLAESADTTTKALAMTRPDLVRDAMGSMIEATAKLTPRRTTPAFKNLARVAERFGIQVPRR